MISCFIWHQHFKLILLELFLHSDIFYPLYKTDKLLSCLKQFRKEKNTLSFWIYSLLRADNFLIMREKTSNRAPNTAFSTLGASAGHCISTHSRTSVNRAFTRQVTSKGSGCMLLVYFIKQRFKKYIFWENQHEYIYHLKNLGTRAKKKNLTYKQQYFFLCPKALWMSPRFNIPDVEPPGDQCRLTARQYREHLNPSIRHYELGQLGFQASHKRCRTESCWMSEGTCGIPQGAVGCAGSPLIFALIYKFALSTERRSGPRLRQHDLSPWQVHMHTDTHRFNNSHRPMSRWEPWFIFLSKNMFPIVTWGMRYLYYKLCSVRFDRSTKSALGLK